MFKRHIVAFSLLGTLLVLGYAGYVLLNKQAIFDMVQEQIRKTSGQDVRFGDLHLKIFPKLQVEIDDLGLYLTQKPLLQVKKVRLELDTDTLLNKALVIDAVTIDTPVLDLNSLPAASGTEVPQEHNETNTTPDYSGLRFLKTITLKNGSIRYGRYALHHLAADVTVSPSTVKIARLSGALGDNDLLSVVTGTIDLPKKRLELNIASKSENLAKLVEHLGIDVPEHQAGTFERLALAASLKADPGSLVLKHAKLTFDDTHIDAAGVMKDYNLSRLAFRTTIDGIDLNRYLPKHDANASVPAETNASADANASLDQLITRLTRFAEGVTIANSVKIGKIDYKNYRLRDIFFESRISDGYIVIDPITLKLYGGRLDGRLTADLRGGYPLIKGQYKISDADVEELFRQKGVPPMVQGSVGLVGKLKTFGLTDAQLIENLAIDIALYGENLIFKKYDLDTILDGLDKVTSFDLVDFAGIVAGPLGMVLVNGYDAMDIKNAVDRGGQTHIVKLLAAWKIRDFVATARDVALKTERHRIAVKGSIDLKNKAVETLTLAVLDDKGCPTFEQTLRGTHQGIEFDNELGIVASPFQKLFENRADCRVFYRGKIR